MDELEVARSRTCIACSSITRIERQIVKLEDKSKLTKANKQVEQTLMKKIQSLDDTFKEHHFVIADQAENAAIVAKQEVLDKHEDKVFSYVS